MEATRERLAATIDQLVYRASPKTIARREVASVKGFFVDARPASHARQHRQGRRRRRRASWRCFVVVAQGHPQTERPHGHGDPTEHPDPDAARPVLVEVDSESGERRSSGGIVIPATAAMGGRRLAWSRVVAVGPHVRAVEVDDRVLFDPEDKAEVEVPGEHLRRDARARHPRRGRRSARRRPGPGSICEDGPVVLPLGTQPNETV